MNTAISMAASSMLEGMRSTPSRWRSVPAAGSSSDPSIAAARCVARVVCSESGSLHPRDLVRSPWGSASTRSTRRPLLARATPRLSAVAVFAVPPFWLATAIVLHVIGVPPVCGKAASREARRRRISGGRGARRPSAARPRRRVLRSGTPVPAWGTRLENAGGGLDFPVFLPFRKPFPLKEWERKNAL